MQMSRFKAKCRKVEEALLMKMIFASSVKMLSVDESDDRNVTLAKKGISCVIFLAG